MVLYAADHGLQADVVFVIEATAVNGAYINDIKSNYIIPSLEYFSQDNVDETSYISENANSLYGIVTYQAADCLPNPCTNTYGPLSSPAKVLGIIDRLELIGGKGESHANVAEGLATALCCFEDLYSKRDANITPQKHCVLICNSPPYLLPVLECQPYSGKSAEQLAAVLSEKNISLSVISPRKIPQLYKLFEKGGGDLTASQTKNYAKDPRHLVLLKGFSLKERPLSPTPGASQSQLSNSTLPVSMPSPLAGNDSPIHNSQQNPNILGSNSSPVVQAGVGQNAVYRPPVPTVSGMRMMGSNQMPMGIQSMPAPPGYHTATGPRASWQMPPPTQQPRPYLQQNQQVNTTTGGSALIAQLQQPPSISGANVNQFGQMNTNSPLNKLNMGQQANVQTSIAQNPGIQTSSMAQVSQANAVATSQAQGAQQVPQQLAGRERHTIWQGILEWIEKPKNMADQKITRHVPCHVSSNSKDGEPEIKADGWPQKLIMQLMPKQLIGTIGGSYLKNSKSVLFHPSPCEALDSLTRVMISNFAGCVHFTSNPSHTTCDIKVLILLYTQDKRAYLGFIPNDQVAFVDRLRKVIQQQKSTQMRPPGNGGPVMNPQAGPQLPVGGSPQQMGPNPVTSQNSGIHIAQTNTISIGGGQITQNVPQSGQPMQSMGGMMNQNVGQATSNQQQPMQSGMMGAPVRAPFENQLQVERQQNLEKINKLKQTLEAAQQQEQQYKSQLERISHMKTSHLQEALQVAQQTEMQFKMLELNQQQQQRMMRPIMANNPGLRHLLQQQPQYRPQIMNMQQMGGNQARGQMGQQMPGGQGGQANTFDEVPNFDFNNIM